MTRPTTIIQNPTWFSFGYRSGRRRPTMVVSVRNPVMKNVVHTRALSTPWAVRPL